MVGKLLVIDGLDGSGKATQTVLLQKSLESMGKKVKAISFPNYEDPSSSLVKMYLGGELADDVDEINAYAASSFYAVDRYASYKRFWQREYEENWVILADRYVSSNAIHQMAKLPPEKWDDFLQWLEDYEYEKLQLPRPDMVLYLDMHPETSAQLIKKRYGGDESKKDLHEKNMEYLLRCRDSALYAADKRGWKVVNCCKGENLLPVETIQKQLMEIVGEELNFI